MTVLDRCSDCSATRVDMDLIHDDTCPLGRAYDQLQADDRLWFALHPKAEARRRPVHWAEAAELRLVGLVPEGAQVAGNVIVTQLAEGVRAKRFHELMWFQGCGPWG